jgi:hypothetical protein
MVESKQPSDIENSKAVTNNSDPKTRNTTPSLYPDVDFVNRTLP